MAETKKLGRYELRRVLGKGAMGVVYEGFDPVLNRRVAVKTILKSVALDEETQRDYSVRFVREAQAVGRLNHPHIVQVHDFGEQDEVAYLVMEFIEGRELRSYFDEGVKFDSGEAVRIMRELLDALDFAHEKNVIHRDVKPANVMLDAQRQVKLADFGVARLQDSDRSAAGTMVGTPAFMSPEQISGGKIDRRTDVFSAGVILYQLLTGQQPFTGEGAWTVARKIMQEEPPLPSSVVGSVSPPVFDDIVGKALAKKPADRFASAKEFRAVLRTAQRGMATPGAQVPAAVAPAREAPKASETEIEFWRALQNSTDAAEFEFYLEQFPEGTYAPLARHKIARLRESQEAQATVRLPSEQKLLADEAAAAPPSLPEQRKTSYAIPAVAAAVVIAAGIGAYLLLGRTKAPEPVAQAPAPAKVEAPAVPPKTEISAAEVEKIRKETAERIHREYADKSAAEQAAAAKAATEKAVQEKNLALKAAAEKAAAEKAVADKAAAEKAAAEKAATEKAAAEKAAAEKLAAAKATAAKAAVVAKPGWPSVGDRWVYQVRDQHNADVNYQLVVDVLSVSPTGIREASRLPSGTVELTHQAGAVLAGVAPGINYFVPYLRAFQEVLGGESWKSIPVRIPRCDTSQFPCIADARVAGKERVSVRAGSFETWKIVVELGTKTQYGNYTSELTYWYAEDIKRFVKYKSLIRNPFFGAPNIDMDLQSYTVAGAK